MDDRIHFPDVGQKLVPQPFALAGSLHQAGNVHKFHPRGDDLLGLGQITEHLQPFIGHGNHADVGFNGAEGKVGGFRFSVGNQGIKQGGLAHVGQSDDSGSEHGSIGRGCWD